VREERREGEGSAASPSILIGARKLGGGGNPVEGLAGIYTSDRGQEKAGSNGQKQASNTGVRRPLMRNAAKKSQGARHGRERHHETM